MNQQAVVQTLKPVNHTSTEYCGFLQRKCACGQHSSAGSECAECKKKRMKLQRRAATPSPYQGEGWGEGQSVPPVVHEVLRSPGHSLEPDTRAFMESRFDRDFSQVRVHTDAKAAESARAVNALAYTVGRDVVFGARQYASGRGNKLLAHELTHVVQQRDRPITQRKLAINAPNDASEREADSIAQVITDHPAQPIASVLRSQSMLQRTCGAALGSSSPDCTPNTTDINGEIFYFEVNCDDLKSGETEHVATFASGLASGTTLKIHGFASIDGPVGFNWDLSCHRANKMASLLRAAKPTVTITDIFKHGPTAGPAFWRRSVIVEKITPTGTTAAATGIRIKSTTVSPDPPNRTRTKLGVGEQVTCSTDPSTSATWSVTGGGSVSPVTGTSTIFTASKSPSTPSVQATVGSNTFTKSFTVVAPASITSAVKSDPGLGTLGPPNNQIGAYTIYDITVNPTDVSFYGVRVRENIPRHTWTWPNGAAGGIAAQTPAWSTNFKNKTIDNIKSGPYPLNRIHNGTNFINFNYIVTWKEQYQNQARAWVVFVNRESTNTEYRGADQKARQTHMGSPGAWQGPWQ